MIKLIIKLCQLYLKKMNKKTIIVTGGLGTIGLALSKSLLKQGHIVIAVDTKKIK